jgi:hypothetical protein
MTHENDGPEENSGRQVFRNGELDEADGAWETCDEVSEVEGTAGPGILLANEMLPVWLDAFKRWMKIKFTVSF